MRRKSTQFRGVWGIPLWCHREHWFLPRVRVKHPQPADGVLPPSKNVLNLFVYLFIYFICSRLWKGTECSVFWIPVDIFWKFVRQQFTTVPQDEKLGFKKKGLLVTFENSMMIVNVFFFLQVNVTYEINVLVPSVSAVTQLTRHNLKPLFLPSHSNHLKTTM